MIKNLVEKLSEDFSNQFSFSFFKSLPIKELNSIEKKVEDEDSLRARLLDSANLFDSINKNEMDRNLKEPTKGSKTCLIQFFKSKNMSLDTINVVEKNLDILFLLRDFYAHRHNKHKEKAFKFLGLNFENDADNYVLLWNKVKKLLEETIKKLIEIVNFSADAQKQEKIDEDTKFALEKHFVGLFERQLNDQSMKKIFHFLLSEGKVVDYQIAKELEMPLAKVRSFLFDLYPQVILISYFDDNYSSVEIKKEWKKIITKYYSGDYYEDETT